MFKAVFIAVVSLALFVTACSPMSTMTANKRDAAFYGRFVNPSENESGASEKLDQLKLLQTGSEYPMRMALFANGKFYYQVDKLGDGQGTWDVADGVLRLRAIRPLFDMNLFVSGASEDGDETVIRFIDRHGFNSVRIELRDPQAMKQQGMIPPELSVYQVSDKGI